MVTELEIRDALKRVIDPEIGRDIVDLGMVRDISLSNGEVGLTLALTTMACPLKDRLVSDIKSAIRGLDGALTVQVNLAEMSAEERARALGEERADGFMAAPFNQIGRVVAVMSGKGGVGKSSIAALLAMPYARPASGLGCWMQTSPDRASPACLGCTRWPGPALWGCCQR